MDTALPAVKPEVIDNLRDAQREADQRVVNELREKIKRLESRIADLEVDNNRLEAWLQSEKMTQKIQHFGFGRFV